MPRQTFSTVGSASPESRPPASASWRTALAFRRTVGFVPTCADTSGVSAGGSVFGSTETVGVASVCGGSALTCASSPGLAGTVTRCASTRAGSLTCRSTLFLRVDVFLRVDAFLRVDVFLGVDLLRYDGVGTREKTVKRSECVAQRMRLYRRRRHRWVRGRQSFSGCQLCLRLLGTER